MAIRNKVAGAEGFWRVPLALKSTSKVTRTSTSMFASAAACGLGPLGRCQLFGYAGHDKDDDDDDDDDIAVAKYE